MFCEKHVPFVKDGLSFMIIFTVILDSFLKCHKVLFCKVKEKQKFAC